MLQQSTNQNWLKLGAAQPLMENNRLFPVAKCSLTSEKVGLINGNAKYVPVVHK